MLNKIKSLGRATIADKRKKEEYLFKQEYHKRLEEIIKEQFGIAISYSEDFSWGYTSTSTYIKDINGNEFVARISENTSQKQKFTKKDIEINSKINLSIKTREYIANKKGKNSTYIKDERDIRGNVLLENKMLTLYPYLQGTPPFDMTKDIFCGAIKILHEIHQIDPKIFDCGLEKVGGEEGEGKEGKGKVSDDEEGLHFLHGDMTPSNILVAYGKVVGVVDFELACIGPVEYDVARCAVFSWYRTKNREKLRDLLEMAKETYPEKLKNNLLKRYALQHAKSHLINIKKHRGRHENPAKYKKEVRFAQKGLLKARLELIRWRRVSKI